MTCPLKLQRFSSKTNISREWDSQIPNLSMPVNKQTNSTVHHFNQPKYNDLNSVYPRYHHKLPRDLNLHYPRNLTFPISHFGWTNTFLVVYILLNEGFCHCLVLIFVIFVIHWGKWSKQLNWTGYVMEWQAVRRCIGPWIS